MTSVARRVSLVLGCLAVMIALAVPSLAQEGKSLIKEIQSPPIKTVGTYNVETFFPAKDRLKFASQLNGFLASRRMARASSQPSRGRRCV